MRVSPAPPLAALFARAEADDAAGLIAALPAGQSIFELRDADGVSLPLFCLYRGRRRALEALLARGEAVPLHEAAALGLVEAAEQALATSPGPLHLLSTDGWTPLHLAAFFGHAAMVRLLLARGADATIWGRAFERNLPLHAACAGRNAKPEVVRLLIPATPELDARQGGGWTPLMLASVNGMADSVELLLAAGADPALRNDKGESPIELARGQGHEAVAARLATRS
jgi:ankyrin repeat protein